jgi:hypothetical protein
MTTVPPGRTSCATPIETRPVAAVRVPLDTSNPRALSSDAPDRKRGMRHPDALQLLRDLTRPAHAALHDCATCGRDLTPCPVRGCAHAPV